MPADITVYVPDSDPMPGHLYLPGDPASIGEWEDGCVLCGDTVTAAPDYWPQSYYATDEGVHAGLIYLRESGMVGEWLHLRCVVDCGQYGTGIVTGPGPASEGRHAA